MAITPKNIYPGRKGAAGTWQKIVSEIPRCEMFIDAMTGSGIISSLVSGCQVVMNDIDQTAIGNIVYPVGETGLIVSNLHYLDLVKQYNNGSNARVFYFDPPYLMQTRSYKKPIYNYEWGEKDHTTFLEIAVLIKCPVMISHYPCSQYDTALKGWRVVTYNTMTRAGIRRERLYMNFPQPVLLQCFEYAGENFTDRQRIKRKIDRLTARLQSEDEKERAVILSSIIANFSFITHKK